MNVTIFSQMLCVPLIIRQLRKQYKTLLYNWKWSWNFKLKRKGVNFLDNHSKYPKSIKDPPNNNLGMNETISLYLMYETKHNSRKRQSGKKHLYPEMFLLWSDFFKNDIVPENTYSCWLILKLSPLNRCGLWKWHKLFSFQKDVNHKKHFYKYLTESEFIHLWYILHSFAW